MKYTVNKKIETTEDVSAFFNYLLREQKVNFHPDESFENYIDVVTREPSFTTQECKLFNRLMNESFDVCERECVNIYDIGTNVMASWNE
ncbi:MAG: hypothetical protein ACI3Y0_04585 [Prevotella sp.]